MEYQAKYITDDIKLSCFEDKFFKSDVLFEDHMLIWFISGETKIVQTNATWLKSKCQTVLKKGMSEPFGKSKHY